MSYKLNIVDNGMEVCGKYGKYKVEDGFVISVDFGSYVNEINEYGDVYLVNKGQVWKAPVKDFTGINRFIKACEDAKLWNVMNGIIYRVKADTEKGLLFIKGNKRNFIIGQDEKIVKKKDAELDRDGDNSPVFIGDVGLYLDETPNQVKHNYVSSWEDMIVKIITGDEWWARAEDEIMDIKSQDRGVFEITDGGNVRLRMKDKNAVIGKGANGAFWTCVDSDGDKHLYARDTLKEIFALI